MKEIVRKIAVIAEVVMLVGLIYGICVNSHLLMGASIVVFLLSVIVETKIEYDFLEKINENN